jgi:CO/xanthine dehydrogenase Mo-binding subunit
VAFCEVEVDTQTGHVRPVRYVSGVDAGTVINRLAVEGQVVGGVHMGLGYALLEDTVIDETNGEVLTTDFTDYKTLSAVDMPAVQTIIADTFEPTGPFGAKGCGEGVTNPIAPAVCNAVYNAVGVRIRNLPITPEKVLNGLEENRTRKDNPGPRPERP